MAALVMTSAAFQKAGRRFWLTKPFAATAVALYIGVTGLPFIIESAWAGFGLQNIADFRLHCVTPSLYLLFWALFVPEGNLQVRDIFLWLIVPFVFGIYALVHGLLTGFYPLLFSRPSRLELPSCAGQHGAHAGRSADLRRPSSAAGSPDRIYAIRPPVRVASSCGHATHSALGASWP